jgi:Uma2 family endonuclease
MNMMFRQAMTVEQFLDWANSQRERHRSELINGQIVPMSPERADHNRIKIAVLLAFHQAISEANLLACEVMTDGMTVRIDDHTAYEPDALVYCGDKIAAGTMVVPNPVIVVEVLSPSTAHHDTSAKLIGYFKVPSVHHYLVIDPETRVVTHHARGLTPAPLSAGEIRLDPPGLTLQVADLLGSA